MNTSLPTFSPSNRFFSKVRHSASRTIAAAVILTVLATGCEFELANEGATAPCTEQHYRVNPGADAPEGGDMVERIRAGVDAYGAILGRTFVFDGTTTDLIADNTRADDSILFEVSWPEDAPTHLGFTEAALVDSTYKGGDVYLNPLLRTVPEGITQRLVMHEMGHLGGLEDTDAPHELMNPNLTVDTFGPGDRIGLLITHPTCTVDLILPGHADFVAPRS